MRTQNFIRSANRSNSTSKLGFTLIELLVAIGVTALLVSLMLGIVTNITSGWNRSSGSLESGNQARLVLDQMAGDLQAAVIKRDTNAWLAATVQTTGPGWTAGGTNTFSIPSGVPPKLEDYRFGPYGVWLRFISTVPGSNADLANLSAPRAISYQIIRLPVVLGSSEVRYQMFRAEVAPDVTFRVGYNLLDAKYNTTDDGGSLSVRLPAGSSVTRANVIANNVVDFGVRIYEGTTLKFPLSSTDAYLATTDTTKGSNIGFPDSIEVFVRILSSEGAQQLALFEAGTITGNWWDIVLANSRVYTRRVEIKSKSL
ncbi:PulJ/GspJ family protein [Rariglobus hedericola]|uniref:Type II secretion system protein n=1 Tax=Rariglobus hedericola TaxID=2597822 RepID=A0A556QMI5_9BACT|nr:type II secretion system protein [Rariglobus hedericola]TSJ77861.1 type II secretion system protein [Rariglobus hedericola]